MVLRVQRANRVEAVDRQLVHRNQVTTLRIHGVTFHGHQVADVVMDGKLVKDATFTVVPFHDLRVDVQRGVGNTLLRVVLGVQGAEANLNLGMQRFLHADDRNAVRILGFELASLDGGLNLFPGINRHVGVQLAGNGDELAVRREHHAVRRLRFRNQEEDAFLDGGFHHQDVVAVDLLGLALGNQFGSLLPVDDVQIVGVLGGATGFIRRTALFDAADVALGTEGVGEGPAVRRTLAGVRQVLRVRRQFDGEGFLHVNAAFLAIELPVGNATAVLLVELFQRVELLVLQRRGVLGGFDDVFGVRGDEGATVFRLEDRVDDDLLGFEVTQVDNGDTRVGLVVDEQELAVVLALGFGNGRVVRVTPGDFLAVDPALLEDGLGVFVEAVALPGFRREDTDVLQDAHGRNAIHDDLAGLAARTEGEEFITLAGRDVGLRCSQQILLVQVTTLHHVLQRLGGHRRTGKAECQQQRGGFHCELTHIYFSQIKK